MKRTLIAAALAALPGVVFSGTVDPKFAKLDVCGSFEGIHINGIMTDRANADANLARIKVVYGNSYSDHIIRYFLAYNKTRNLPIDLYDSAMQVIRGYMGATWENFMSAVNYGIYNVGMSQTTAKAIATKITDMFAFTRPAPYHDQDLNDIMNEIYAQTAGGQYAYAKARRVFIPHSQGNLYMNLVYDRLIANGTPATSMGVVGMAVPYSSVRSGNNHVTSWNDIVIDATRLPTLNAIVTPNVSIPYQPSIDVLGHNLRATYLANSTARSKMNGLITAEFGTLKTTVTLSPYGSQGYFGGSAMWAACSPAMAAGQVIAPEMCRYVNPATGAMWDVPIVQFEMPHPVTPQSMITRRAGSREETAAIATSIRDTCIAKGAAFWNTKATTGVEATGQTYGCGQYYDNWYLGVQYNYLRSGDYISPATSFSVSSNGMYGTTNVSKRPMCRN